MARSSHRLSLQSNFASDRLTASSLSIYLTQDKDKDGGIHYRSDTERAGFFSCMHFLFGVKLIRKLNLLGNQPLMEDHLDPVGYGESCQTLEKLFTENYYESRLRYPRDRKLMYLTIYKIFKKDILIQFLCQLVFGISRIMTTYFLYLALKSVRDPDQTVAQARPYAVGLFLGLLLSLYSLHQFTFKATYAANKMKIGILGMVYRKITKLSLLSVHRANLGKILNVVTCDANNMENIYYVISIVVAPFALFGAAGVLYYFWGLSGLVGVGYMLFSWIILQVIASLTLKRRRQRSTTADDRIRLLNEILEAVRLIKLNAWELFGFHTVSQKRKEEVKFWKKVYFLDAISRAIVYSSHWIAIFFMLLTYTLLGNQITAPKIFPTILLMTYLRQICMIQVNSGISYIVQLKLLSDRVISIMDLPEIQTHVEIIPPQNPENAIEFKDFTGFWPSRDLSPQDLTQLPFEPLSGSDVEKLKETTYPVLSNINLDIKKGSLVMIIGKGGSGKSSLLLSFTREMAKSLGELRFEGNFEYMPQTPLFLAGSVRDNIIFGKPYNEPFFWRVVEACCLTDEINNLPNKEKTEIGERGANLTGKQKALIGLARSIYARAEIYLLDDPFSELEPELAKNVFSKAFERLLKGSTVLLVTKEMNLIRYADKIVVMDRGKIQDQGTCEDLGNQMNRSDEEMKDELYIDRNTEVLSDQQRNSITDGTIPFQIRKSVFAGLRDTYIPCISKGIFSEEAKLEEGKVTLVTYWKYLKSIFNLVNIIPAIILFVGTESAGWQLSVRLANWADGYTNSEGYVVISTIVFGGLLLYLLKFFLYYNSALNGSQYLHNKMLKGVMDIPLTQFAKYSIGRILNRFSIDVAFLDTFLMMALLDVLEGFCLFMVFLIALWVKVPWILLPAGVGVVAYLVVFALCNKAIGKTRNLTLATRSPLYSMFTATVAGLTTIRARNQSEEMFKAFCRRANDHSRANISYRLSIRVMSFFLDYLTQLIIIGAFCYLLYEQQSPLLNGSFVNMLVQLPSTMQWLLINLINLHSFMVSASRVMNYCQKYDEDEALRLGNKKRKDTPEEMVELSKLSNAFTATDKSLLRNVISNIHLGEKVAVVGDTRASLSLLAYLNSTMDENNKSSDVYSPKSSDKIHVGDNSILFIRNSMTIITGEIHIFTASIRDNLDPRKEYKDSELWEVLDLVGLKDFVENLKNKLDTRLSKGSFVFSESQRQLLCIARAMLRKTSILIQDKATNKIDIAIDQILQKKIEQRFHNSTILTATNRLLDIAEYDKILYIKSGIKHEFAEPYSLLVKEIGDKEITNRKGGFARLVLGMDAGMSREISRLAMVSFCTKRGLDFHLDRRPQSFVVSEGSPMKTMGDLTGTISLVLKEEEER